VSTTPSVGWFAHPSFLEHETGAGHPERPARLRAITEHLQRVGLWDALVHCVPAPAARETLALVHPASYIELIERACREGPVHLDPDTAVSPASWEAALRAVGAVTQAVDAVHAGRLRAAFCAVRPPGHHALAERAMGFCVFNNVAVGARHAQHRHNVARVLIVDWDVHHGNGTQAIFYDDPSVLYVSMHQHPFYPGTGAREETGAAKGRGFTVNVPVPAGSGDAELLAAFREVLVPEAERFDPQLVFISAGFDAHHDDPLAGLQVTDAGYQELTRIVRQIADRHAQGRIVSALEGGYDLDALGRGVEAHVRALLE